MKDGRELGKQKKTCGLCKHVGHNISTCPKKKNSTSSNGANKRKKNDFERYGVEPGILFEMLGWSYWSCKRKTMTILCL